MNNSTDPRIESVDGGLSIIYNGRHLYSRYNPEKRPNQIAENSEIKSNTLYIVPSPLLGYGLAAIQDKLQPEQQICIIELDPDLKELTGEYWTKSIHRDKYVDIRESSEKCLKNALSQLDLSKYRHCEILPLNSGYQLYKEKYSDICKIFSREIRLYWQNRMTIIHMGPLWIKNLFRNLKTATHSLSSLKCHRSVFVAGAGESLERALSFIQNNRDRICLLCVDTALPYFLKNGVKPDYILVVEAQWINTLDFYYEFPKDIPVISDITSYPKILRDREAPIYFFSTRFSQLNSLNRILDSESCWPLLPSLGSVGIYALYIARLISSEPCFIAGLDFAFDPAKPHCRGAASHEYYHQRSNRLTPATAYSNTMSRGGFYTAGKNGPVFTTMVMYNYKATLNQITREMTIYDLGDTGLPLGIPMLDIKTILPISGRPSKNPVPATLKPANGKKIIEQELQLLTLAQTQLGDYLNGNKKTWPSLEQTLNQVDYLYFHFADFRNHVPENSNFLNRCLLSCSYYIRILSQLV